MRVDSNNSLVEEVSLPLNYYTIVNKVCRICASPQITKLLIGKKVLKINEDGIEILKLCNGKNTLNMILKKILQNRIDKKESEKSTIDFIKIMVKYNVICFKKKPGLSPLWLEQIKPHDSKNRFFPLKVSIELTDKCNLACIYCYRDAKIKEGSFFQNPIEVLHKLSIDGVVIIELTGGEPLLHPDIEDILSYSFKNFLYVGLLTNGILLNDKIFKILNNNKNKTLLQISLPTLKKDRFKKITGFDMLSVVKENIMKAGKYDFTSQVSTVLIDDYSFSEIEEITKFVYTSGIDKYVPSPEMDIGRGKINSNISFSVINNISDIIKELNKKYKNIIKVRKYSDDTEFILEENKEYSNCGAGWRSFTFDPNGYSRPCTLFPVDFGSSAFNNKEMIKKMYQLESPNKKTCDGCTYENSCRGCIYKGWLMSQKRGYECRWAKENKVKELFNDWEKCKVKRK